MKFYIFKKDVIWYFLANHIYSKQGVSSQNEKESLDWDDAYYQSEWDFSDISYDRGDE